MPVRLLAILALVLSAATARAEDPQVLVDRAKLTADSLLGDANFAGAKARLKTARGVLIVPQLVKAGLIVGGEGGAGLILAHDGRGNWSAPAFVTLAAASLGLQIGVEAKEVMFIIVTDKGLNSMLTSQAKLGADASIAAGPVGAGVEASTVGSPGTDIIAYSKSVGLFGGASLEGALIRPSHDSNRAYYGRNVTPSDILIQRSADNTGANALKAALTRP
jgi:lipid-binding SYLF domain-containing protein